MGAKDDLWGTKGALWGVKVQTTKKLYHSITFFYLCAGNFSTILLLVLCAFK